MTTDSKGAAVGLERSNPVACLQARGESRARERSRAEKLLALDWELPPGYVAGLGLPKSRRAPRRNGVVGLVVDKRKRVGFVDRLTAKRLPSGSAWKAREGMPFQGLEILGVLLQLFEARGPEQLINLLPEAKSYQLIDELAEDIAGPSMTIAAMLAVLDAETGSAHKLLECAVSLVQRSTEDSGKLQTVEGLEWKLAAFQRECESGSLCLVAPGLEPELRASLDATFDQVWEVGDLGSLGRLLDAEGLLDEFGRPETLGRKALDLVEEVIAKLGREDWQVDRELDLAQRLAHAATVSNFAKDVPFARRRSAQGRSFRALRYGAHLGLATAAARRAIARIEEAGDAASYDELATADVDLAASLYVDYEFEQMAQVMGRWHRRMAEDPKLLAPGLRIKILGNLARALAVYPGRADGPDGWRAITEQALALHMDALPGSIGLTRGFFLGALLAHGDLDRAEAQIDLAEAELGGAQYGDNTSRWFLQFNRADLARRRGTIWDDPKMEQEGLVKQGQFGRPLGYYFQATARQAGRQAPDAARRFLRAASYFAAGSPAPDSGQWHFVHLLRLGAAERAGDSTLWSAARDGLLGFHERPAAAPLRRWFRGLPQALPRELPGSSGLELHRQVEQVLALDPYFLGIAPQS
ncbi:MAG: hypothetical protein P8R48_07715 [Planctomycetota bacterium]|nr:hypothetical protein [Planctomycetota bacterium]